ncbi:SMODS domain-containing nucleotidyltransferase [Photobacterium damselae]|uniref:SMODS domain-containing nucleotidyltransferase n=1 Tax=Photobacterium damselae TaxID=38293 RepID=UPI003AAB6F76
MNSDFRGIDSDTRYSLFVGSYGRGTDIHVSDIDLIVQLPYVEYAKYDSYIRTSHLNRLLVTSASYQLSSS